MSEKCLPSIARKENDVKMDYTKLLNQVSKWVDQGEYLKVLETLLDIPREDYNTQLVGILARTYNSLGEYEKAIPLLLSIEDESRDDTNWFYRLGNSYYYTGRTEEAEECFIHAAELDPDDIDTQEFIYRCRPCFTARVELFWQWFEKNESTLSAICEHRGTRDRDRDVDFVETGLSILGPDILFNMGGSHEFTFSVHGEDYLFYLTPYIVDRMPAGLRSKWHVNPYNRPNPADSFTFHMYGQQVPFKDVRVAVRYDVETNAAALTFFHPTLCHIDENDALNAFSTMLDVSVGEAFTHYYVGELHRADKEEEGMMPLTEVRDYLRRQIESQGRQVEESPDGHYGVYHLKPATDGEFYNARFDVVDGTTNYMALVHDYYYAEMYRNVKLMAFGAKAAYLGLVCDSGEKRQQMLELRYELEDRIAKEIFLRGDGHPGNGRVLGGATGLECMYIDLLLFDEKDFIRRMREMAVDYPVNMYLSDFRLGAWYTLIRAYDDNAVSHKYLSRCIQRDDI